MQNKTNQGTWGLSKEEWYLTKREVEILKKKNYTTIEMAKYLRCSTNMVLDLINSLN